MLFIFLMLEGFFMCFLLLLTLVIGIANGPEKMVIMYEKDVQERALSLGLTTKNKMKKSFFVTLISLYLPILILIPAMVCFINGARGFFDIFLRRISYIIRPIKIKSPIAEMIYGTTYSEGIYSSTILYVPGDDMSNAINAPSVS